MKKDQGNVLVKRRGSKINDVVDIVVVLFTRANCWCCCWLFPLGGVPLRLLLYCCTCVIRIALASATGLSCCSASPSIPIVSFVVVVVVGMPRRCPTVVGVVVRRQSRSRCDWMVGVWSRRLLDCEFLQGTALPAELSVLIDIAMWGLRLGIASS
eukprot:2293571-Amphidinium_carterae.2